MSDAEDIISNITITGVIIRFSDNKLEVLLQQFNEGDEAEVCNWELPRNSIKRGETAMETVPPVPCC